MKGSNTKTVNQTGDNVILFICMGIFIVGMIAGCVRFLLF